MRIKGLLKMCAKFWKNFWLVFDLRTSIWQDPGQSIHKQSIHGPNPNRAEHHDLLKANLETYGLDMASLSLLKNYLANCK